MAETQLQSKIHIFLSHLRPLIGLIKLFQIYEKWWFLSAHRHGMSVKLKALELVSSCALNRSTHQFQSKVSFLWSHLGLVLIE